jgi:uncharacterized protein
MTRLCKFLLHFSIMAKKEPWFAKDGLKFTCSQCGDCCSGAPGFVWVNQEEINAMAVKVNVPVDEFEEKYVRKVGARRSLVEYENGDCVFLDTKTRGCTLYNERPRQCKTWPFWNSNIESPEAWKETCEVCPGSGVGKVYTVDEILKQAAVINI